MRHKLYQSAHYHRRGDGNAPVCAMKTSLQLSEAAIGRRFATCGHRDLLGNVHRRLPIARAPVIVILLPRDSHVRSRARIFIVVIVKPICQAIGS